MLLLVDQYPIAIVIVSYVLNLTIAWLAISQMKRIIRFLGQSGVRAASKVASLLLAAIAIKMIRQGLVGMG